MADLTPKERKGFFAGMASLIVCLAVLILVTVPGDSPLRSPDGEITAFSAPLMQSIVPLIFIFFLIPGVVHGLVAGTVKSSKDVVDGMSTAMGNDGLLPGDGILRRPVPSLPLRSPNVGVLLAVKGANFPEGGRRFG